MRSFKNCTKRVTVVQFRANGGGKANYENKIDECEGKGVKRSEVTER